MREPILGDFYLKCTKSFLFGPFPIRQHGRGRVYDLYCNQTPGGSWDILVSPLGNCHVVHLYRQSMMCAYNGDYHCCLVSWHFVVGLEEMEKQSMCNKDFCAQVPFSCIVNCIFQITVLHIGSFRCIHNPNIFCFLFSREMHLTECWFFHFHIALTVFQTLWWHSAYW